MKKNSAIHKGITAVLLFQVFFFLSYSQEPWSWSTPAPITDSVSNNCNPFLFHSWYLDDVLMVWEKSTDTASAAIYMKFLSSPDEEFPLLSDPGVHYTNPVIMQGYFNQILFMLFYESDQTGVKNIHYLNYDYDGNFSEPQAFFHTPYDDKSVDIGDDYVRDLAWTSGGELKYSKYDIIAGTFTEPETISNGICANPKIRDEFLFWEMEHNDASQIFGSKRIMNEWTEPVMITGYEDVRNLSKADYSAGLFPSSLIWSALSDSTWKMIVNFYEWSVMELSPESDEPFDPAIASYTVLFKEPHIIEFFISFPAEENGFMEIFTNEAFGDVYFNLSLSGTNNRNPALFLTDIFDNPNWFGFYVYLMWESDRNGHWQLYYSRFALLLGNVEERSSISNILTVSPNPADARVTLSYWLDEPADVQLVLTDFSGKTVATFREGYKDQGSQSTEIKLNSLHISPGIYLVCLITDDQRICSRLVKTK